MAGGAAPVPVSAARAERDAIMAAQVSGAQRKDGIDQLAVARRIAAALNAVQLMLPCFYWVTGLTKDGTVLVANTYGLGFIPDGVNLPANVKLVTADESVPVKTRGTWASYPILALNGWAQHHGVALRAVIATEDQFKGFDPGAHKEILTPDDIPENGTMAGRDRLTVLAPGIAQRLTQIPDNGLLDILPAAQVDNTGPEDRRIDLLMEVFRPLFNEDPSRVEPHMRAMVDYANYMQEVAVHAAHNAADGTALRTAVTDALYWQHFSVMNSDVLVGQPA